MVGLGPGWARPNLVAHCRFRTLGSCRLCGRQLLSPCGQQPLSERRHCCACVQWCARARGAVAVGQLTRQLSETATGAQGPCGTTACIGGGDLLSGRAPRLISTVAATAMRTTTASTTQRTALVLLSAPLLLSSVLLEAGLAGVTPSATQPAPTYRAIFWPTSGVQADLSSSRGL